MSNFGAWALRKLWKLLANCRRIFGAEDVAWAVMKLGRGDWTKFENLTQEVA